MATCAKCGSAAVRTDVPAHYEAVTLGAPFKVIIENAVKVSACANCGTVIGTYVPDMEGLFHAVVFARALEPRKLTGDELKFMRTAMNWKAKDLAKSLGITAEYLSRCENGKKVMAETPEKLFRLHALLKTPDRTALEELDLSSIFDLIKIDATWDAAIPITLHFVRCAVTAEHTGGDDEKWRKDKLKKVA